MWPSTSAVKSSMVRFRPSMDSTLRDVRVQDQRDGSREALPLAGLLHETLAAGGGQGVEARLAVVRGHAPLARDPSPLFQSLQRRVQRAVFDEQFLLRRSLDGQRDALSVLRSEDQGAKDQQVQRPLQQLESIALLPAGLLGRLLGRHLT